MKTIRNLLYSALIMLASVACSPEKQPPTVSCVFSDVAIDATQHTATITCRNESVDGDKVHANLLLSKNENITDAIKYPLFLEEDVLRGIVDGLDKNTVYYFCFEVYTVNQHKRSDEVFHFETASVDNVVATTMEVNNVMQTTAQASGNVTAQASCHVSARGVCWDTNPNPNVLQNSTLVCGEGTGTFSVDLTELTASTTYYLKAFAMCDDVVYYGNEVTFTTQASQQIITGAIDGRFSVSANKQVLFSKGNLQYNAGTNIWRFAENQYDFIGDNNANVSSSYNGWIDLFGWGTSGYDYGAVCYQPWSTSTTYSDYGIPNVLTGNADWGYNAISNGGNTTGQWRTLTQAEWKYIINSRPGIRYAGGQVNNVNGLILLPDGWNENTYTLYGTNTSTGTIYDSNIISLADWKTLENAGAVFLPAAGYRERTTVSNVGSQGYYWAATSNNNASAQYLVFSPAIYTNLYNSRFYGQSVRLVLDN